MSTTATQPEERTAEFRALTERQKASAFSFLVGYLEQHAHSWQPVKSTDFAADALAAALKYGRNQ